MQYLLTIWMEETEFELTPEVMAPWKAFNDEAAAAGVLRGGSGLQPSATATTVRGGDDEVVLTDGPFVETKEQLAGYYVVECADLDEAIVWAGKVPAVQWGAAVEVRPVNGGTEITQNSTVAEAAAH